MNTPHEKDISTFFPNTRFPLFHSILIYIRLPLPFIGTTLCLYQRTFFPVEFFSLGSPFPTAIAAAAAKVGVVP